MNNQKLAICPACGGKLDVADRQGDYLDLTCGSHGNFCVSIDAIIMANNSVERMDVLRQWIESGRASSFDGVICTYDLCPNS